MRWLWRIALAGGILLTAVGPATAGSRDELLVSAAISLKEAFQEIGRLFTGRTGTPVVFNFGASGALAQQIEAGAPVDVFASAAAVEMDLLDRQGLLLPGTRRLLARNVLVVVVPADARADLARVADLVKPSFRHIAIGNPRTVPAGEYAREGLQNLKLWDTLYPRLVLAENVRQVLDYVIRGEVDAGIVYRTDAKAGGDRVRVAAIVPEESHHPVTYPIAVLRDSRLTKPARAFVGFVAWPQGQGAWVKIGCPAAGLGTTPWKK